MHIDSHHAADGDDLSKAALPPARADVHLTDLAEVTVLLSAPAEVHPKYQIRCDRAQARLAAHGIDEVMVLRENVTPSELQRLGIELITDDPHFFVGAPGRVHHENAVYKHLRALEVFLESEAEIALVCEDDLLLHPEFESRFSRLYSTVPDDWDLLYVGFANPIVELLDGFSKVHEGLWKGPFWCTHCFLITRAGAEKIMAALPIHDQIDFFYGRLARDGVITCYGVSDTEPTLEDMRRVAYTPRGLAYQERDSEKELE